MRHAKGLVCLTRHKSRRKSQENPTFVANPKRAGKAVSAAPGPNHTMEGIAWLSSAK